MNKRTVKSVLLTVAVMGILFTGATVTAFASGIVTWSGSEYYYQAVDNLSKIGIKITNRDEKISELEELKGVLEETNAVIVSDKEALESQLAEIKGTLEGYFNTDLGNNGVKHQLDEALTLITNLRNTLAKNESTIDDLNSEVTQYEEKTEQADSELKQAELDMLDIMEKSGELAEGE